MNFGGAIRLNKTGVLTIGICAVLLIFMFRNSYSSNSVTENSDASNSDTVNLKELLSAAIEAAERGGKKVHEVREQADLNIKSKGETLEGAKELVSDGDMFSHKEMYNSIKNGFPKIEVISEEKGHTSDADVTPANKHLGEVDYLEDIFVPVQDIKVWIDPLDATQEFTENLLQYVTTMVCIAVKGVATIGVIHKPFGEGTFWGWKGIDVSKNLQSATGKIGSLDDPPSVIVSRSHTGEVRAVLTKAFGNQTAITEAGGAGYKTLEVIQGNNDAYVHITRIKKWDLCAGNAILNAKNGIMTNLDGADIDYSNKIDYVNDNGILATMVEKHKYYLSKLKSWKEH